MARGIPYRHPDLIAAMVGVFVASLLLACGVAFWFLQRAPAKPVGPVLTASAAPAQRPQEALQPAPSAPVRQIPLEPHPTLGYWPQAEAEFSATARDGNGVDHPFRCTTDAKHHRVSVGTGFENRKNLALFFGCSFAYGFGVDDAETLPSQVARRAPEYAPYNFGANGYGPQNMYLQLKDDGMMSAVVQKEGVIVYVFINEHLPRALGVPNVTVALPYVSLENGQLAFNGTVKSNHRFYLWAEELSSGTKLWPVLSETMSHWNERDALPLVAKILIESKRLAERRFPSVRFCVLIYPHQDKGTLLMPLLEGSGMRILDYSAMSLEDRSFWFVDAHPTAQNYAQVAQALVRDLNLQDRN